MKPLKMYICIKQSIPSHKVLGAAHGVLIAHLNASKLPYDRWCEYDDWLKNSFRKVVVEVSDTEFDDLKLEFNYSDGRKDYIIVTESGLDNQEIAIVFYPRREWPEMFKKFPLLKV